jgi:CMP-N,N'-diacetyllegionaminic acid synthase
VPSPSALAIVPARGGSKGLPNKNLLPLGGEPLIVHTIRAALAAGRLDGVVCTTDSPAIAEVAAAAGAEIVMRPLELAGDESPTENALVHALDALGRPDPDYVVTLEPTSPLRSSRLIDECIERAFKTGADSIITIVRTSELVGGLEDGVFRHLKPGQPRRRQLRSPLYHETSTVYVTRTAHLRATRSVLGDVLHAVVVPQLEAVDIDDQDDYRLAEALLRTTEV